MRNVAEEFTKLDAESEDSVQTKLAQGVYGHDLVPIVEQWLRSKEESRKRAAASRTDKHEEEAIALAREANLIARQAAGTATEANSIARGAKAMDRRRHRACCAGGHSCCQMVSTVHNQTRDVDQLLPLSLCRAIRKWEFLNDRREPISERLASR
jgi:hypothetical protein